MPDDFEPKSALKNASMLGLQAGALGLVYSTLQNALGQHSSGALGVFTRTGSTITFFAAMGAAFAFTEATVANQRQKNDHYNGAAAGCAAGFLAGIRARSLPIALGGCAFLGTTVGIFDKAGAFTGTKSVLSDDQRSKFFKKPLDLKSSSQS
ncbi:hypothetical protein F5879DRAFT_985432 [Lentinula edodes]|uniref:uncharacterized protein n=1 Tax=Lentinula edodes TaxID=5353 RepID=UPI001E8D52A7|nr:uncharacterized protein C8R40DRAFT_1165749 [Lentinula edodes]KAH7880829.1 hypothetical protein C8R40DRAFT_1165749 [Lentinula edodes]KAJ3908599.1 hypothetical protein F5879DRAFT_985432 [Lentinula edodes]